MGYLIVFQFITINYGLIIQFNVKLTIECYSSKKSLSGLILAL